METKGGFYFTDRGNGCVLKEAYSLPVRREPCSLFEFLEIFNDSRGHFSREKEPCNLDTRAQ
jgi:hypothetical protein